MSYFGNHPDMFDLITATPVEVVKPWKPRTLTHEQWPPNYTGVYAWRIKTLRSLRSDPIALASAKAYYRERAGEFIQHWMDTYNPRKKGIKWMPFVFFWRQQEFIEFLEELRADGENGLVEKCRDIGATWLVCAYSVWCFLFLDDFAFGWGSRKQELVDKIGDPDSIFEKMRLLIGRLPDVWLPQGWKPNAHATFMKLLNPDNGSTITGESGDNIGRGGRKSMYGKDESAHYERAEKIEAALGDNTDIQLDISSVNGLGNVFHRRRQAGIDWSPGNASIEPRFTRVFVFDWRHHPEKDQEWYDRRKAKAEREGMLHVFAQEVDRNYSAAISNTVIPYEWIEAALDAHKVVPALMVEPPSVHMAGLDVADEGMDMNALALRQWVILRHVEMWGERDPGVTARRAMIAVRPYKGIKVQYDSIGVGSNVKSEYNRLREKGPNNEPAIIAPGDFYMIPWNAGGAVVNPFDRIIPDDDESLLNKDFYHNFKAQAWWSLRTRFYKTWRCVKFNDTYPADELISIDSAMGDIRFALMKELAQPTYGPSASGLRTLIQKKPDGTKSPNLADAVAMSYFPAPEDHAIAIVGAYSG